MDLNSVKKTTEFVSSIADVRRELEEQERLRVEVKEKLSVEEREEIKRVREKYKSRLAKETKGLDQKIGTGSKKLQDLLLEKERAIGRLAIKQAGGGLDSEESSRLKILLDDKSV